MAEVLRKGRKHCGRRRNCSLREISPFLTVFSKDLYCRHVKNQGLFGKELTHSLTTKLKAFADEKLNVTKLVISVFDRVENIVGTREIACICNFSFSHIVFKRLLSQTRQKVSLCGDGSTLSPDDKF